MMDRRDFLARLVKIPVAAGVALSLPAVSTPPALAPFQRAPENHFREPVRERQSLRGVRYVKEVHPFPFVAPCSVTCWDWHQRSDLGAIEKLILRCVGFKPAAIDRVELMLNGFWFMDAPGALFTFLGAVRSEMIAVSFAPGALWPYPDDWLQMRVTLNGACRPKELRVYAEGVL
ncbi:MAG TPA: hypothetical protein VEM38_04510 [Burkholderiales bacterium]|nr:hypothetical protein [Burkholderiales bacterium]